MPKSKAVETAVKGAETIMLRMGKANNVIQWKEDMYSLATEEFGEVGTYFYTNVAYQYPFPHEREYNPFYVELTDETTAVVDEDAANNEEEDAEVEEDLGEVVQQEAVPLPDMTEAARVALIKKLREGAFEARRKRQEAALLGLRKMWSKTWVRMSPESQSKVREDPGFKKACLDLDSIKLWTYIRKTHLTHIHGDNEETTYANIHDQSVKYNNLRQGDKEKISDFKIRFDHQVQSNKGAGMADISERLRVMDFLGKLDSRRYNGMLTSMRNCACQNLPGSYPKTLSDAYRTASTWTREGVLVPLGSDSHSAFLADTAFVTKGKDPKDSKASKPPGEKSKEKGSSATTDKHCYACGKPGHISRDCRLRKAPIPDIALMVSDLNPDEEHDIERDQFLGDIVEESTYITKEETVLLSIDDVVFDNGSTIHLIKNAKLLTEIAATKNPIVVSGVQTDEDGVRVSLEGKMGDIGTVYYSKNASANILSMSTLVDSGAIVKYNPKVNRFTVQLRGSSLIYSFCRKSIDGNESKFYVCNMNTMVASIPTSHPQQADILVTTVAENMVRYTKREVLGARKARDLLARLGYPSVQNAIAMLRDGTGFDVTAYDFQVADAIWGPDIASLKGKQTKAKSMVPDTTLGVPIVQQQQTLVVDIMFIDQVSTLVAVAYPLDLTLGVTLDRTISGKASRAA